MKFEIWIAVLLLSCGEAQCEEPKGGLVEKALSASDLGGQWTRRVQYLFDPAASPPEVFQISTNIPRNRAIAGENLEQNIARQKAARRDFAVSTLASLGAEAQAILEYSSKSPERFSMYIYRYKTAEGLEDMWKGRRDRTEYNSTTTAGEQVIYTKSGQTFPGGVKASEPSVEAREGVYHVLVSPGRPERDDPGFRILKTQLEKLRNASEEFAKMRNTTELLSPVLSAAQFIEVTADLELTQSTINGDTTSRKTVRCVFGTNSWQMDGDSILNGKTTYWFIDSQVIEYSVVTKGAEVAPRFKNNGPVPAPIGSEIKRITQSLDGNPGRPVGDRDLLSHAGRVAWLAFCSGPCLKRDGREVFPPSDQWKHLIRSPFVDKTVVFEDSLGLPREMSLYTTNSQPVVQYSVTASTNILGWQIPLEFYLAQYQPAELPDSRTFSTNAWQLHMVTKGKVTAVAVGSEPHTPAKLWGEN